MEAAISCHFLPSLGPPCCKVRVVDVFSMPQSGNSVSVEAVDPVFQAKMLDMLKQTGRRPGKGRIRGKLSSWFLWLAGWFDMFDFDVVTVIPIVERPTFDFAQSHPHRKMVGGDRWSRLFFCYCISILLWSFQNGNRKCSFLQKRSLHGKW